MTCYYCGKPATHYCTDCGHLLCDSGECGAKARAELKPSKLAQARFVVKHPIRAARIAPHVLPFSRGRFT